MALLTIEQFRKFVATSLEDDELEVLLDAAESAITALYGPVGGPVEETSDGGQTYIFLRRRASAITGIVETDIDVDTTLAADDWRLRDDGVSVRRLWNGTNAREWWGYPVVVTYTPADDLADRKRIQLKLVELDLNNTPGVTSERIGEWEEQHSESSVWNYPVQREAILASLAGQPAGLAPGFA